MVLSDSFWCLESVVAFLVFLTVKFALCLFVLVFLVDIFLLELKAWLHFFWGGATEIKIEKLKILRTFNVSLK